MFPRLFLSMEPSWNIIFFNRSIYTLEAFNNSKNIVMFAKEYEET